MSRLGVCMKVPIVRWGFVLSGGFVFSSAFGRAIVFVYSGCILHKEAVGTALGSISWCHIFTY